jgi:transcriptional regulator with XRE-family HTH domain
MNTVRFRLVEGNTPSGATARAGVPATIPRMKTETPDHDRFDDRNADYRTVKAEQRLRALIRGESAVTDRRANCPGTSIAMSERDAFGPRLRRERERRGISLETLALVTNVSVELWAGLEQNDFSQWPGGVFARAFVRDYASAIGLDADDVVGDFCRLFPVGDRRVGTIIRAQSELIGHDTTYADDRSLSPGGIDRRVEGAPPAQPKPGRRWLGARLFAALFDT